MQDKLRHDRNTRNASVRHHPLYLSFPYQSYRCSFVISCVSYHSYFQPPTLTATWTLRPVTPHSLHLRRGHHTGLNLCRRRTCRGQHRGIATRRVNYAMLIFDMQPPTVSGSPRHHLLNVHSVCHAHMAHMASGIIPHVGARFGEHAGHGLFGA